METARCPGANWFATLEITDSLGGWEELAARVPAINHPPAIFGRTVQDGQVRSIG
jgi:hypothetical protein